MPQVLRRNAAGEPQLPRGGFLRILRTLFRGHDEALVEQLGE
jgi:ribosomal protein L17